MRNIGSQIETPRLLLRPSLLSDTANLFEFLGDKEAMRHTHVDATPAACRRRIAVHEWQRRRDGYAPWTVIRKDDAKIIGWGGLYDDPFEPGWGCGCASELVTAALRLADRELRIREVCAFAHPDNTASRKILEMAGFRMVRFVPEMNRLLLSRPGREDDTANRS